MDFRWISISLTCSVSVSRFCCCCICFGSLAHTCRRSFPLFLSFSLCLFCFSQQQTNPNRSELLSAFNASYFSFSSFFVLAHHWLSVCMCGQFWCQKQIVKMPTLVQRLFTQRHTHRHIQSEQCTATHPKHCRTKQCTAAKWWQCT